MNQFEFLIKENFDTILILILIFFFIKEGVEDMETLFALTFLLLS